ncbi:hypothetical protein Sango_0952900 [Sesamum angolense]|uniref:Uncharacterized protein n=1 Tax=Sesamum angolense TaxID=2727404 RepID=A0AAE2BY72_9LAMI|nr:hypothetical protein Sango_0952900 [Sesamum angolense]
MEKKSDNAGGFSGEKYPESAVIVDQEKAAVDCFYEKLGKLNESSGLSSVFNFREALLDLHLFYKEVIKRGGFYQPYVEASKMDKERYEKELATYNLLKSNKIPKSQSLFSNSTPSMLNFSTSSETDDVYHVSWNLTAKTSFHPTNPWLNWRLRNKRKNRAVAAGQLQGDMGMLNTSTITELPYLPSPAEHDLTEIPPRKQS